MLIELDRLKLHEEVDPDVLFPLLHQIEGDGVLWSPVIVDGETLVVLDGTHRVTALRMLGCRYTCAFLVDYRKPEIGVDRWFRAISEPLEVAEAFDVARGLDLELIPLESSGPKNFSYPVLRLNDGSHYVLAPRLDVVHCYDAMRRFEQMLEAMGYETVYDTEQDAEEKLMRNIVSAILQPPAVRKDQVVNTAMLGRVFSCKATRHIIPRRPVGVDVPLKLLKDHKLNAEKANVELAAMIERKRTETLPPGTIWRGQRYDEELCVFTERDDILTREHGEGSARTHRSVFYGQSYEILPKEEPPNRGR